jgi:alpha-mannosidase
VALTLFRAYSFIIQPSSVQDYSWQTGSQCLGQGSARLAFYPHADDWAQGEVYPEALKFNTPLRLFQMSPCGGTELAPETSFLEISDPNLIFSCLKAADDGAKGAYVLRVYNPTREAISAKVKFHAVIKRAELVTLEELPIEEIKVEGGHEITIEAGAGKIVTVRVDVMD